MYVHTSQLSLGCWAQKRTLLDALHSTPLSKHHYIYIYIIYLLLYLRGTGITLMYKIRTTRLKWSKGHGYVQVEYICT